jgi:hypothetical protein
MREVFDRIEQAVIKANLGPAGHMSMSDAFVWFQTLGIFERAGISIAALDMTDPYNPVDVRFDPDPASAGAVVLKMTRCILDGRIFLYFDKYELVALIAKTTPRKWFRRTVRYTPFFVSPGSAVLTGPTYTDEWDALDWVEKRQRRAEEVMPAILAQLNRTSGAS